MSRDFEIAHVFAAADDCASRALACADFIGTQLGRDVLLDRQQSWNRFDRVAWTARLSGCDLDSCCRSPCDPLVHGAFLHHGKTCCMKFSLTRLLRCADGTAMRRTQTNYWWLHLGPTDMVFTPDRCCTGVGVSASSGPGSREPSSIALFRRPFDSWLSRCASLWHPSTPATGSRKAPVSVLSTARESHPSAPGLHPTR